MSMNQIAEFLKPGLRISESQMNGPDIYCFIYDTILWSKFQQIIPSALILGLGRIDGWTFHVNEKGKANIRVGYMNGNFSGIPASHMVLPAPSTRLSTPDPEGPNTYGWIYKIPRTADARLHEILGVGGRVRIIRTASLIISTELPKRILVGVPVIAYWDPRHTCNFHENVIPNGSTAQIDAKNAVEMMRRAGLPIRAGLRILNHLRGMTTDIEPLFVRPSLLPGKESLLEESEALIRQNNSNVPYACNEYDDVEVDFDHHLNSTPSPPSSPVVVVEKSSKAQQVHKNTTGQGKGVIASSAGKGLMGPPPRPKTTGNPLGNARALTVKDLFEAARKDRGSPSKRQGLDSQEGGSGRRGVHRYVDKDEDEDYESDPEWDPRRL